MQTAECGYATVKSRLSVRPFVRDVQERFSHRLGYFENNFMAEYHKVPAHTDPNMGNLVQLEHSQN